MWEVAFDVRCELGEGPIYDARENELIWFDIIGQKLFIASLATQHITQHSFDEPVSGSIDIFIICWRGVSQKYASLPLAVKQVAFGMETSENRVCISIFFWVLSALALR